MLVVTAYHPGDTDQALRFATWLKELGGAKGHELILVRDTRCDAGQSERIRSLFAESFDAVEQLEFVDHFRKWPDAPNAIFGMVARHILRTRPQPWLFCEPDCVLLCPGAFTLIFAEYLEALKAGKFFLGDFVSVHTPELDVPDHMSGNAVYPGDMISHAGVALIAGNVAWDVAAAPQIVPAMHTSRYIHHSWKHRGFENWGQFEGEVLQFKPECCLFHADKTGSLYPLLRARMNLPAPVLAEIATALPTVEQGPTASVEARESTNKGNSQALGDHALGWLPATEKASDSRGGQSTSIFIKSWAGDKDWLPYCLRSIEKFATGFSETVLMLPLDMEFPESPAYRIVRVDETHLQDGYLAQQCRKLHADENTDAGHILFTDSDTIFTRPVTPETYFRDGKIIWLYTPWEKTNTPWKPIVEKFMKWPVEFEFMRRHPTVVPRWLLSDLREFCQNQHKMTLDAYVMSQPHRSFSEFNVIGAFAYAFHRDKFVWVNTEEVPPEQWPELTVLQKFSWGGLTDEVKAEFEAVLSDAPTAERYNKILTAWIDSETHGNGDSLHATLPSVTPWENKEQSLAEIARVAGLLKNFCDNAAHVRAVREILHRNGVISLSYRMKKRKGWKKKK